jgi:hypothetical protein
MAASKKKALEEGDAEGMGKGKKRGILIMTYL